MDYVPSELPRFADSSALARGPREVVARTVLIDSEDRVEGEPGAFRYVLPEPLNAVSSYKVLWLAWPNSVMNVKPGTRLRWSFAERGNPDAFFRGTNVYRDAIVDFYPSSDLDATALPSGWTQVDVDGSTENSWQVPLDAPATIYEGAERTPRAVLDYRYDEPLEPGHYSVSTLLTAVLDVLVTTMVEQHADVMFHAAENRFTFVSDDARVADFAIVLADPSLAAVLGFEPGTHACDDQGRIKSTRYALTDGPVTFHVHSAQLADSLQQVTTKRDLMFSFANATALGVPNVLHADQLGAQAVYARPRDLRAIDVRFTDDRGDQVDLNGTRVTMCIRVTCQP